MFPFIWILTCLFFGFWAGRKLQYRCTSLPAVPSFLLVLVGSAAGVGISIDPWYGLGVVSYLLGVMFIITRPPKELT